MPALRALLLWLLILALPVYGASGTSLRLLGPAHWHSAPAAAPAVAAPDAGWLQPAVRVVQRLVSRVQDLRQQAHARAHALGQPHEHRGLQRHWHDAHDGSVHAVGSADPAVADLVAGASVGSAMLVLAAPSALPTLPAAVANGPWAAVPTVAWRDAPRHRSTPPPRR